MLAGTATADREKESGADDEFNLTFRLNEIQVWKSCYDRAFGCLKSMREVVVFESAVTLVTPAPSHPARPGFDPVFAPTGSGCRRLRSRRPPFPTGLFVEQGREKTAHVYLKNPTPEEPPKRPVGSVGNTKRFIVLQYPPHLSLPPSS